MNSSKILATSKDYFLVYWLLNSPEGVIGHIHHCALSTGEGLLGVFEGPLGVFHAVLVKNQSFLDYWSDDEWTMPQYWQIDLFLRADSLYDAENGSRSLVDTGQEYKLEYDRNVYGQSLQKLGLPFYPEVLLDALVTLLEQETACCEPMILDVYDDFMSDKKKIWGDTREQ